MERKTLKFAAKIIALIAMIVLAFSKTNHAGVKAEDIVIGQKIQFHSDILNEERTIFISTPENYSYTNEKYPVLYILDGEDNFVFSSTVTNYLATAGRVPNMIVVGINNTVRIRDFTPTQVKEHPGSGCAENFLKFMKEEMMPYINNNYRAEPYNILCGHCLCGMFSIHTLFTDPELFDAHVAISPYLSYDNEIVLKEVKSTLKKKPELIKYLYVTVGNEPMYIESLGRLEEVLQTQSSDLNWKIVHMEREDHSSVLLKSLYDGLEFIYSDWNVNYQLAEKSLDEIREHFKKLSAKYGYDINIPETLINRKGYLLLSNGKVDEAIEIFQLNVQTYPGSANVYDSLGEAFESRHQYDLARKNYQKACELGKKNTDPNYIYFQANLDRIDRKMLSSK